MKCDSQASFLACTFANPCFGREPKVRVAIGALSSSIYQNALLYTQDFFPSLLISPILPSYVQVQIVLMAIIDSHDPFSDISNIDLIILAYIDDLLLDA